MTEPFEPLPQNDLVRPVAFVSLMVLGAWNVCGWLASDAPLILRLFMAGFTLMFEVLCFNVSAQKARADERETGKWVRRFWFSALFMCCGWSMFSAHNALMLFTPDMSDLQRAPAYVVLALAAVVIPLLPWAIELTERAPMKKSPDAVAAGQPEEPKTGETIAGGQPEMQKQEAAGVQLKDRPAPERPEGSHLRDVGRAALAAGFVVSAVVGAQGIEPPQHMGNAGDQSWRAYARDLWVGGLRNTSEIARRVGRPRETVRRELMRLGA